MKLFSVLVLVLLSACGGDGARRAPERRSCPVSDLQVVHAGVDDLGRSQVRGTLTTDAPLSYLSLSFIYKTKEGAVLDVQRLGANWLDLPPGTHVFEGGSQEVTTKWERVTVSIAECRP